MYVTQNQRMSTSLMLRVDEKISKVLCHSTTRFLAHAYSTASIKGADFPIPVNEDLALCLGFTNNDALSCHVHSKMRLDVDYIIETKFESSVIDSRTCRHGKRKAHDIFFLSFHAFKTLMKQSTFENDQVIDGVLSGYASLLKELDDEKSDCEWVMREQDEHIQTCERALFEENDRLRRELASLTEDFNVSQRILLMQNEFESCAA